MTVANSLWRGRLGEPKTEASKRSIEIPRQLIGRLLEHRAGSKWTGDDDFVFARSDGSPQDPDHLRNQVLYPAMKAAGITRVSRSHGFHIFRHSFGSILHKEIGDPKVTPEALSHSRISTTMDTYVNGDSETIGEGFVAVADTIWPRPIEVEGSDRIQ